MAICRLNLRSKLIPVFFKMECLVFVGNSFDDINITKITHSPILLCLQNVVLWNIYPYLFKCINMILVYRSQGRNRDRKMYHVKVFEFVFLIWLLFYSAKGEYTLHFEHYFVFINYFTPLLCLIILKETYLFVSSSIFLFVWLLAHTA